jgi:hypothetical protein
LLVGYPPFFHDNQAKLFDLILEGKLYFEEVEFELISAEGKDFLQALMKTNPDERLSATEVNLCAVY